MSHSERSNEFVDQINEIFSKFWWEYNTKEVRLQICHELKSLFDTKFDKYLRSIGIHPKDMTFIDMAAIGSTGISIGISILGANPITLSEFVQEHFGLESIRDKKIEDILGSNFTHFTLFKEF